MAQIVVFVFSVTLTFDLCSIVCHTHCAWCTRLSMRSFIRIHPVILGDMPRTRIHTYIHTHIHTYIHIREYMYVSSHICMHVLSLIKQLFYNFSFISGFHQMWNGRFQTSHPSLWTFITKMKDVQSTFDDMSRAAILGEVAPPKRRKWRSLERRIRKLKREYSSGQRNLDEYWQAISYSIARFG